LTSAHRGRARVLHRRDSGGGRVPGRKHRVEEDDVALGDVGRQLHVVLDRLERLLVPVEADEADAGARDQAEDAVEHSEPRAQDRADRHLLAGDPLNGRPLERRLDLDLLRGESLRRLVREEERDLVHELAEEMRRRRVVAQHSQLVLDQWVVDDHELFGRHAHAW
jgi:hypothetical protein